MFQHMRWAVLLTLAATTWCGAQSVIYVDSFAAPGGDGSSWALAYSDLQDALTAAADPLSTATEIWVAQGKYRPGPAGAGAAVFQLQSGLAVYGGFDGVETTLAERQPDAFETILSADLDDNDIIAFPAWDGPGWSGYGGNGAHIVDGTGTDATAILDGFVISGAVGGAFVCSSGSPVIQNCLFRWNAIASANGGAAQILGGSPTFDGCRFVQNRAFDGKGGGIMISGLAAPVITNCEFVQNRTIGGTIEAAGGGIYSSTGSAVTISHCSFDLNRAENLYATGSPVGAFGAGIYNFSDNMIIEYCTFWNNWANAGAGIYSRGDLLLVDHCAFHGNTVAAYPVTPGVSSGGGGGGLALSSNLFRTASIVASTFYDNLAGEGGGTMTYGNFSGTIDNCVFWANVATGFEVSLADAQAKGSYSFTYSCVEGLFLPPAPGEPAPDPAAFPGCIQDDPLLLDAPGGNLRLSAGSPCIDAGDNTALVAGTTLDLDDTSRFFDDPTTVDTGVGPAPITDMGAYEFAGGLPPAQFIRGDCNDDGGINLADVIAGLNALFALPGVPITCNDACDVNDDGTLDISDPIAGIGMLFSLMSPPPFPYPGCGVDPSGDALDCATYAPCP